MAKRLAGERKYEEAEQLYIQSSSDPDFCDDPAEGWELAAAMYRDAWRDHEAERVMRAYAVARAARLHPIVAAAVGASVVASCWGTLCHGSIKFRCMKCH